VIPQKVNHRNVIAITPNLALPFGVANWFGVCQSEHTGHRFAVLNIGRERTGRAYVIDQGHYTNDIHEAITVMNERAGVTV
jgi:hypothetical protein